MIKKILFVSGSLNRGGAQRVITLLAEEYISLGWDVHMAVLLDSKVCYSISERIVLHDLVLHGDYYKNTIRWIHNLQILLKKEKPDVVVAFAGRINMISMLAARGMGIPVLVSERNDPARDRRSKPEQWLSKWFYGKADRVVFQTKYQAKYYEKYCRGNSVVIGNPISAPVYVGEHEMNDIISVGKLMDQKNHSMLIQAFATIAADYPEKQVYIYGEGPKRSELEALIRKVNMVDRIHLQGSSDNIFDLMHKYKYFVMCSNYEGLSNALLEAMISGMVCLTTAWNGVEEIVEEGINGYLVPVGDVNALALRLREMFTRDNSFIVREAIKTGKEFSGSQLIGQWRQIIEHQIK